MSDPNPTAQALGRLGKGIPKRYTIAERQLRAQRMHERNSTAKARRDAAEQACRLFMNEYTNGLAGDPALDRIAELCREAIQ